MMGQQKDYQQKFFITGFDLDKRVPEDHILRKIDEQIDFEKALNFLYGT